MTAAIQHAVSDLIQPAKAAREALDEALRDLDRLAKDAGFPELGTDLSHGWLADWYAEMRWRNSA